MKLEKDTLAICLAIILCLAAAGETILISAGFLTAEVQIDQPDLVTDSIADLVTASGTDSAGSSSDINRSEDVGGNFTALPKRRPEKPKLLPGTSYKLPQYNGSYLQSDRHRKMESGTLQVVAFYDGAGSATLTFHCDYDDDTNTSVSFSDIPRSGQVGHEKSIDTIEYSLHECRLNGKVTISGVMPDGAIDGLAFGVYLKDQEGNYCMYSSRNPEAQKRPSFVGTWPLGLSEQSFNKQVDTSLNSFARKQIQVALTGAEYLQNGTYQLPICQYMK